MEWRIIIILEPKAVGGHKAAVAGDECYGGVLLVQCESDQSDYKNFGSDPRLSNHWTTPSFRQGA